MRPTPALRPVKNGEHWRNWHSVSFRALPTIQWRDIPGRCIRDRLMASATIGRIKRSSDNGRDNRCLLAVCFEHSRSPMNEVR
ncbi:hypothetical protein VTI74DRAFT_6881 [Chaetomium olivicolor]